MRPGLRNVLAMALIAVTAMALAVGLFLQRTSSTAAVASPSEAVFQTEPDEAARGSTERTESDLGSDAAQPLEQRIAVQLGEDAEVSPTDAVLRVLVRAEGSETALSGVEVSISRQIDTNQLGDLMEKLFAESGVEIASDARGTVTASLSVIPPLETDEHGQAEFHVPEDTNLFLSASSQDPEIGSHEQTVDPIRSGETCELVIHLPVGGLRFVGRVLDRSTRIPLSDVAVVLEGTDDEDSPSIRTDESGWFELSLDRDESYSLKLIAGGYGAVRGKVELGHDTRERAQVFRLWKSASVHGRLVGTGWSKESQIEVSCKVQEGDLLQPIPEPALLSDPKDAAELGITQPDADGRFEFSELPPRVNLLIEARAIDGACAEQWLALRPGEARELDLAILSSVTLRGTVVDIAGRPVGTLRLWLKPARSRGQFERFSRGLFQRDPEQEAACAEDGSFQFEQVLPGSWFLGPAPAGSQRTALASLFNQDDEASTSEAVEGAIVPVGTLIEVLPEPSEQATVIRVHYGETIAGVVLDPDSNPVAKPYISAECPETGLHEGARARSDGTFVLGPLVSGTYSVKAYRNEAWLDSDPITAASGSSGLILRLKPSVGSINGRVTNLGGGEAWADLWPTEGSGWRLGTAVNADGSFEFKGLADEECQLVVSTEAGQLGVAHGLRPSREGSIVEVTLQPTTVVRITYEGNESVLQVSAEQEGVPVGAGMLTAGSSTAIRVLPGPVHIKCSRLPEAGGLSAAPLLEAEAHALAGEEVEVLLQ